MGWIAAFTFISLISAQDCASITYADHLSQNGEYYRAISEYQRYLFFKARNFEDSSYCYVQMAKCYYSGEDYEGAISFIESIRKYFSAKKVIIHDLNWYAGLSYLKMGFSKSALWYFEQDTSLMKSRLLQGIAQLYIYDWAAAYGSFSNSNEDQDQGISDISNELMFIAQKGSQLKLKKPVIAGIFSAIIPGAGYAYAGSYQTALSSLLINTGIKL